MTNVSVDVMHPNIIGSNDSMLSHTWLNSAENLTMVDYIHIVDLVAAFYTLH